MHEVSSSLLLTSMQVNLCSSSRGTISQEFQLSETSLTLIMLICLAMFHNKEFFNTVEERGEASANHHTFITFWAMELKLVLFCTNYSYLETPCHSDLDIYSMFSTARSINEAFMMSFWFCVNLWESNMKLKAKWTESLTCGTQWALMHNQQNADNNNKRSQKCVSEHKMNLEFGWRKFSFSWNSLPALVIPWDSRRLWRPFVTWFCVLC